MLHVSHPACTATVPSGKQLRVTFATLALGFVYDPPALSPRPAQPRPLSPDDARDLALIERIRAGGPADRAAWGEMVRLYQDRIFSVCMKMLRDREAAADLTQETFVRLIQGLETYDGRSKLSTWLIRVAMNACLSYLRAQKLRKHASLDAGLPPSLIRGMSVRASEGGSGSGGRAQGAGREQTPGQSVELHERRRRVAAALAGIEPDQRAILILRDVQGLEYEQIAVVLEIAGGTVKSRLFRARMALREALEKLESRPPPPSPPPPQVPRP